MQLTNSTITGRNVVFDSVLEDIPGGVNLDVSRLTSDLEYIKAGTLVNVNKATRIAEVVKTAVCVADSVDGDNIRVAKGHLLKAGEYVTDGYVVAAISSITTSNATYDILVVGTTLVNYGVGVVLKESAAGKVAGSHATVSILVATGNTFVVNDPTGKAAGITVSILTAADDNLAVAYAGKTLTISLASTTATKNTPAVEIQAAVRALSATDIDFGGWTLAGADIAGSGVTGTKTGVMAVNEPLIYTPTGFVKDQVAVAANIEASVVVRGAVRESALPYPVDAGLKAKLPMFTFNT
jgi:hypothetical protein